MKKQNLVSTRRSLCSGLLNVAFESFNKLDASIIFSLNKIMHHNIKLLLWQCELLLYCTRKLRCQILKFFNSLLIEYLHQSTAHNDTICKGSHCPCLLGCRDPKTHANR